jgi:hypothetical protein
MSKKPYIDILRETERLLEWLDICQPARLSPDHHKVFIKGVIDAYRRLLITKRPDATEDETKLARRLLEQLDQTERRHF